VANDKDWRIDDHCFSHLPAEQDLLPQPQTGIDDTEKRVENGKGQRLQCTAKRLQISRRIQAEKLQRIHSGAAHSRHQENRAVEQGAFIARGTRTRRLRGA
jgi:hypothetical protein